MTVTACDSPDALSAALSGAGEKLVRNNAAVYVTHCSSLKLTLEEV